MQRIRIPVRAYMLTLYPRQLTPSAATTPAASAQNPQLAALASGLAIPSFWTENEVRGVVRQANTIWAQASIELAPLTIASRDEVVPADGNGMWAHFIRALTPGSGIAAAFVHDLPSNEGGWGGGRIAVIAGRKGENALPGFMGGLLAHEIGHILLGATHHNRTPSRLMYESRHPRVASANLLEASEIHDARRRASAL